MSEPKFAFEKKLGISEMMYGDIPFLANSIAKLLYCMKETNEKHRVDCQFFRLDFRTSYFDEQLTFPMGCLILDLKWGSKKELEEKKD